MNETVSFGCARRIVDHLATENVPECAERVVERLIVDALVEILYENVSDARSTKRRIALGPHDAHGNAFDRFVVERVERAFGCVERRIGVHRLHDRGARARVK